MYEKRDVANDAKGKKWKGEYLQSMSPAFLVSAIEFQIRGAQHGRAFGTFLRAPP